MEKQVTAFDKQEMDLYVDATMFSDSIKEKIKAMSGVVLAIGENDIVLDFADLKAIMEHGGVAFVGTGEFEGEESATQALKLAIEASSLDYSLMPKILGVLIYFVIHPDFPILNLADAMETIHENAHYISLPST